MSPPIPEVSVVIPLYNKGPYIARAIQSVLDQTVLDFEIIVIDGGSTDGGPDAVKKFADTRIRFMRQEGTGVSAARNEAVRDARSALVAFLDADDEWEPRHLETLVRLRKDFPAAGLLATIFCEIEADGRKGEPAIRGVPPPPWEGLIQDYFFTAAFTEGTLPFITSSVAIPKTVFDEVNGFEPGIQFGEDVDLWFRIALKYPFAFSREGEAIWHKDIGNRLSGSMPRLDRELVVSRAMKELGRDEMERISPYLKEYIAVKELNRSLWNIKAGRPGEARKILASVDTRSFRWRKLRLSLLARLPAGLFRALWRLDRSIKKGLLHKDYRLDPWLRQ
ncbi:MAG TPA: glycosyltransferase family 2 protein [Methanomicrobiales archaeon]|nr:glycosyltransferase family 2 protein [Methanomicrobiales archaeon]